MKSIRVVADVYIERNPSKIDKEYAYKAIVSIEGIRYDVRIKEIWYWIPTLNKEDNLKGDEYVRLSDLNEYEENDCDMSEECMPEKKRR
ncbi:hypothetical protein L2E82_16874 [Cichorium intybus]|uniref:Uncharacterized protein n=1 Tax=Cichorium intybus TaxID=13427 RepID=A0ACB9F7C6_CICIN|nr:hypothetical protein L2E82_16874 [Cichorium intybus]